GEDLDRGFVGALLGLEAHLGFHRGAEEAFAGFGDGGANLVGAGASDGFDEQRRDFRDGEGLVGQRDAHHQERFLFAAAHREDAVGRSFRERFAPLEVVLEFGGFGGGVLADEDLGRNDGVGLVAGAEFGAGGFVVADAFGDDVAGA